MEAESKIHPLAIIHENAKIGKNVEIGPFGCYWRKCRNW